VSDFVDSARCGAYELVAQRPQSLSVRPDNTVELIAEDPYLVKIMEEGDARVLGGALSVPDGGSEGILRFGNFIGAAELGGRALQVRSRRLNTDAAAAMLDEVCAWLSSLPFGIETPVSAPYTRERQAGPEVLFHVFAVLRDAMNGVGPHSLAEALERILARPHESLRADLPWLVPLGGADRLDPATLNAIPARPELLEPVPAGSSLAQTPLARRLGGRLPRAIEVRPLLPSTDTPENRFVCGVLVTMTDLLRRFERIVRAESRPSAATNAREAREIADYLQRCRRHRALANLRPLQEMPPHSTVLRSRPGYRELLGLHSDLLGRSLAEPHDAQRLLESRDAAAVYEYWCYIRVVGALESLLGPPLSRDRFEATPLRSELRWGYRVSWPEVTALYNASFSKPAAGDPRPGLDSYSLRLRPDIVVRGPDSRLNLFDAKLKRRFAQALDPGQGSGGGAGSKETFAPEDLHKMHAYRDALGADGVWVLYPGSASQPEAFAAPGAAAAGFQGVGAVSLAPGAPHDGGLQELLRRLL
jgi:hypothetical protein